MFASRSTVQGKSFSSDNQLLAINYFDNTNFVHACTLNPSDILINKPKWLRNTTVSESNLLTRQYFTSSYLIEEELKRHINGPYWYIIHPCSNFAVLWGGIMFVVHFVNWYVILFQLANRNDLTYVSGIINFIIQCPCYMNIVLRFFMGYCKNYEIVLNQRTIACNYLKTWFITDLITSVPFQVVEYLFSGQMNKLLFEILILYQGLKVLTFIRIRKYFKQTWLAYNLNYGGYMIMALILFSVLVFHACTATYQLGGTFGKIMNYNVTHPLDQIKEIDPNPRIGVFWFRYLLCQYIVAIKFYCFSFAYANFAENMSLPELVLSSVIIFTSLIYHLYAMVKVIQLFQYRHSAKIKYQEVMNQLKEYMRTKHLPLTIKTLLFEFYEQRYQYRFFKEKSINENLSDSLRHELKLHCGQLFIRNIEIFKDIPDKTLTKIVTCLKPEIFMPNDLIIKAGTVGDCMYFIASGTVSIRTATGHELLHLEDGDHFGEISLFSKHGKRVSNIVAIEYCEIYRLDKTDYVANIAIIPELADKFETLAMHRMNATTKMENTFKKNKKQSSTFDNERESVNRDSLDSGQINPDSLSHGSLSHGTPSHGSLHSESVDAEQ